MQRDDKLASMGKVEHRESLWGGDSVCPICSPEANLADAQSLTVSISYCLIRLRKDHMSVIQVLL